MKEGGNSLINGLFEAKLSDKQKSSVRPDNHTDLELRSRFIYDKYQHRKWYSEEAYQKLKLREKADMALQKQKSRPAKCPIEEDFFAARTAMKGSPSGEHLATKNNDENEWWKDNERKGHKQNDAQSNGSKKNSKNFDFLGDRRNLLSNLQMESKSRLMTDLSCLGIDKGALPSQIRTKATRNKRRERKNGVSPVQQEDRQKSSWRPAPVRQVPNRSKSATSSSSEGESSRSESNKGASCQSTRKHAPVRSASGPLATSSGASDIQSMNDRMQNSGRDIIAGARIGRADSLDDSSRNKGSRRRSRSSSMKRSRGAARKNRTLVASLYDGSLTDSISAGLATVDTSDSVSTVRRSRRRRGDEESEASTRRGDEKSIATHRSGRSVPREEASQTSSRRSRSNRKVRSPTGRNETANGSFSRTPSPDLTHDSRRRILPMDTPPRTPMRGAPIKIKRVPKDLKPRSHSRASKSPMRNEAVQS